MCIFILLLFPIKKRNITFKFLFQTFSEFFDRQTALDLLRSSTPEVPEEEPEVLHRCPNSSLIRVFSHLLEELHPESMVHPGLLNQQNFIDPSAVLNLGNSQFSNLGSGSSIANGISSTYQLQKPGNFSSPNLFLSPGIFNNFQNLNLNGGITANQQSGNQSQQ